MLMSTLVIAVQASDSWNWSSRHGPNRESAATEELAGCYKRTEVPIMGLFTMKSLMPLCLKF